MIGGKKTLKNNWGQLNGTGKSSTVALRKWENWKKILHQISKCWQEKKLDGEGGRNEKLSNFLNELGMPQKGLSVLLQYALFQMFKAGVANPKPRGGQVGV